MFYGGNIVRRKIIRECVEKLEPICWPEETTVRDSPAVHDSTRSFPEMFPAMAGPLEELCALPRRLL